LIVNPTEKDKQMIAKLDQAVAWFGVEKTIEILEEYNQDFEGLRPDEEDSELDPKGED